VKDLWNKVQENIIEFIRYTADDFVAVWEFRPNVIILFGVFALICLFV
jgi:hypothetical protein